MSQFIQLHMLTSYAPSNLNRDDLGRPKTAIMGGSTRLRVSSQSLKRHWRTSDLFEGPLAGKLGTRTRQFGEFIFNTLIEKGIDEQSAQAWARKIGGVYGALEIPEVKEENEKGKKTKKPEEIEKEKAELAKKLAEATVEDRFKVSQLVHISPKEKEAALSLVDRLVEKNRAPETDDLKNLKKAEKDAVDIALFGRMSTSIGVFNDEAACQVAHAISVHSVTIEDDYFTAVDDLNEGVLCDEGEQRGAAHVGEIGFAAALFYSYLCINKTQLIENLGGDDALANKAIESLVEAAAKVSPTGKQNSFASRAYATYILAEKGTQQPRSLSVAFLEPVQNKEMHQSAITALEKQMEKLDGIYGSCADCRYSINAIEGTGSFAELCHFVTQ